MLRPTLLRAILTGSLIWLGCGPGVGASPRRCASEDQCAPTDACVAGTCVSDTAPTAVIAVPDGVEANALYVFDGTGSCDPDAPDDRIVSYAWSFTAAGAPCTAPVVAGTDALARVRFGCPGRYTVRLVVKDEKGLESAPASRELVVAPYAGRPLVEVGPDVTVGHVCGGSPGRCTTASGVSLSATVAVSSEGPVKLRWSVEPPPGRELGPTRRVQFVPGADVAAPTVQLETDDAAISGDWVFRVEAWDAAGLLGGAAVRVSITNRPPVIAVPPVSSIPHSFDPGSSTFLASGSFPVSVTDPDGDPMDRRPPAWHHAGDGDSTFEGEDQGSLVTFRIEVPYGSPADAAHLIGGEGLERAIALSVQDVNGGECAASVPVVVTNSPPAPTAPLAGAVSVNHSYDRAAAVYRASMALGRWSDPDGDPLRQVGTTSDPACPVLDVLTDGTAVVQCSRGGELPGAPALNGFAGSHPLSIRILDPFGMGQPAAPVTLNILNRAPIAFDSRGSLGVSCGLDRSVCCEKLVADLCKYAYRFGAADYRFSPWIVDLDGDPLQLRGLGSAPTFCLPGSCGSFTGTLEEVSSCADPAAGRSYSVSDGVATVSATHTQTRYCN
jgi:hypothetical protein